jgi:hypothetical protein
MRYFTLKIMRPLFEALEACQGVEQMEVHHPEGDVFIHSLQVLRIAFKETVDIDLILAAMLHDVGKAVDNHNHEKEAVSLLGDNLSKKSLWLIEHHMRIWYLINGEMKRRLKVQELINHGWITDLFLLARWDKMGRQPGLNVGYDRGAIMRGLDNAANAHFEHTKGVCGFVRHRTAWTEKNT